MLVKSDGEIKLGWSKNWRLYFDPLTVLRVANQELCSVVDKSNPCDVRAVGRITMELMQKYPKEDGAIGIENLNRWSVDSQAVRFLSMTTSAESVEELKKVGVINISSQQLTRPARVIEAFMVQRRLGVAGGASVCFRA